MSKVNRVIQGKCTDVYGEGGQGRKSTKMDILIIKWINKFRNSDVSQFLSFSCNFKKLLQ